MQPGNYEAESDFCQIPIFIDFERKFRRIFPSLDEMEFKAGFMKTVPSMYTLLMNTIYPQYIGC